MKYHIATEHDLDLLAEWNYQLIQDEGHRNPMTVAQLKDRMRDWIQVEYKAVLFEESQQSVAYALYRESADEIYLRQLFVARNRRRQGVGKQAMAVLFDKLWPKDKRLVVEVLSNNDFGVKFWRTIGFKDYAITLEIMPK